jgi:hypothetical protein
MGTRCFGAAAAVDAEGVHAMQEQGPVERAVREALVVEVLVAVGAVLRLRVGGPGPRFATPI